MNTGIHAIYDEAASLCGKLEELLRNNELPAEEKASHVPRQRLGACYEPVGGVCCAHDGRY
jgi:hypothetical protein